MNKITNTEAYRALPRSLKVADSDIGGQGLFLREGHTLEPNTKLGLAHLDLLDLPISQEIIDQVPQAMWRSPLVSFINHDDNPNCVVVRDGIVTVLFTLKEIQGGEELTLDYNNNSRGGGSYLTEILEG